MKGFFISLTALLLIALPSQSGAELSRSGIPVIKSDKPLLFTPAESQWLETKPILSYVYDPDWPPFEWTNAIQEHTGIIPDILAIISNKTGIKFNPVRTNTWREAVALAETDKVDMYSAVAFTEKRGEYLNFTSQSIYSYIAIFVSDIHNSDFTYDENHSLAGKKIALIEGNQLSKTVEKINPDASYVYVSSAQEGFNMVRNKEADLFAVNAATGLYFINHKGYTDIKVYENIDFVFDLKIALQKRIPPEAISAIDKSLLSIDKKTLSNIFNKWTAVRFEKEYNY